MDDVGWRAKPLAGLGGPPFKDLCDTGTGRVISVHIDMTADGVGQYDSE